jgi:carbonic anhydrase
MDTKDILLSAALDSNVLSSSESFIDECYAHNIDFARTYDKNIYYGQTTSFKRLAVICCMVARLYVFRMLGLKPGEAHIILNGT